MLCNLLQCNSRLVRSVTDLVHLYGIELYCNILCILALYNTTCICLVPYYPDTRGCAYSYLTQPPSEIPCKPYVTRHTTSFLVLSMECVVNLPKADQNHSATIHWTEKVGEHVLRRNASASDSNDENYLLRSVLRLEDEVAFNESDVRKYWCELSFHDNTTFTISNVATVNPPEYYSSLPPCHHDTVFHLAEASCAETGQSLSSPFPTPSPLVSPHCSSDESSGPRSLNTMVLTIVAIGIGVPIILATMLLIAALSILLVRRKRRERSTEEHTSKQYYRCILGFITLEYVYIHVT